jgi:predicted small secreted protein
MRQLIFALVVLWSAITTGCKSIQVNSLTLSSTVQFSPTYSTGAPVAAKH